MQFNYELSPAHYRKGVLIKHKGIPLYCNGTLITPFSIVWWWPLNWLIAIMNFWRILKKQTPQEDE